MLDTEREKESSQLTSTGAEALGPTISISAEEYLEKQYLNRQLSLPMAPSNDDIREIVSDQLRRELVTLCTYSNGQLEVPLKGYTDIGEQFKQSPEKIAELFPNSSVEEIAAVVENLTNSDSSFDANLLMNDDGQLFIVFQCSTQIEDYLDGFDFATQQKIPEQAFDAVEVFSSVANLAKTNNLKPPISTGHSLGAALAQLVPGGIGLAGPGFSYIRDSLESEGVYENLGVEVPGLHTGNLTFGYSSDPVTMLADFDTNLNGETDHVEFGLGGPRSVHVGGLVVLNPPVPTAEQVEAFYQPTLPGWINQTWHMIKDADFAAPLEEAGAFVLTEDTETGFLYNSAMDRSFPILERVELDTSLSRDLQLKIKL